MSELEAPSFKANATRIPLPVSEAIAWLAIPSRMTYFSPVSRCSSVSDGTAAKTRFLIKLTFFLFAKSTGTIRDAIRSTTMVMNLT
jgi:hypothetical protein